MMIRSRGQVAILGAGVSGLSLAYQLSRPNPNINISIFERESRIGGWFNGIYVKDGKSNVAKVLHESNSTVPDKYYFELGPHSMRPSGKNGESVLNLLANLGILTEAIPTNRTANIRYIYKDGMMYQLPISLLQVFTNRLTRNIPFLLFGEIFTASRVKTDESIHSFFSRHFNENFSKTFIASMTSGIFAGDIEKLSIRASFPLIYQMEQENRSLAVHGLKSWISPSVDENHFPENFSENDKKHFQVLKQATGISFPNGISHLTTTLHSVLDSKPYVNFSLGSKATSIKFNESKVVLDFDNEEIRSFDKLVSAISLEDLLPILPFQSKSGIESKIDYASVSVINLGYKDFQLPMPGFGHLLPASENSPILGMIYDSNVFPAQVSPGTGVLTVMLGGVHHPYIVNESYDKLATIALEGVRTHLGIDRDPSALHVSTIKNAIPQYLVGFHESRDAFLQEVHDYFNGQVHLIGNNFFGPGIADSIHTATKLAKTIKI